MLYGCWMGCNGMHIRTEQFRSRFTVRCAYQRCFDHCTCWTFMCVINTNKPELEDPPVSVKSPVLWKSVGWTEVICCCLTDAYWALPACWDEAHGTSESAAAWKATSPVHSGCCCFPTFSTSHRDNTQLFYLIIINFAAIMLLHVIYWAGTQQ